MSNYNEKDHDNLAVGTIALGTGIGGAKAALPGALGQEVMYHGTDSNAWSSIQKEGLKASRGGKGGTLGAFRKYNILDKEQIDEFGNNKIYATHDKALAKQFQMQAQVAKEQPELLRDMAAGAGSPKDAFKNYIRAREIGKRGKVMHVMVPYDDYLHKFKLDPDIGAAYANRYQLAGKKADKAIQLGKRHAAYISEDISPTQILESKASISSKLKYLASNIAPYYKQHPIRALGYGAGLLGATALTGFGLNKIYNTVKEKRRREVLKTASLAFETWKESQY